MTAGDNHLGWGRRTEQGGEQVFSDATGPGLLFECMPAEEACLSSAYNILQLYLVPGTLDSSTLWNHNFRKLLCISLLRVANRKCKNNRIYPL